VKRLLLDTQAMIWWDANNPELGGNARAAIQNAEEVYVSAVSAWEIMIKAALGKLRTTRRPAQAVAEGGFIELPVSFEHTEALGGLPMYHNNPFDRLLLAAAAVERLTIITSDRKFTHYDISLLNASN